MTYFISLLMCINVFLLSVFVDIVVYRYWNVIVYQLDILRSFIKQAGL